jgi:hypothetical protein
MIFVEALFVFVLIAFIWLIVTLIMFKKLNKARITGVLLILMAFIAVGAVIFVVGHFLEWHETNEMCGEMCHAMEGPYDSYTQPKNNTMMEVHFEEDVPCAQCHSGPGFIGLGTSFLPVPNEGLHQYVLGYDEDDLGGHVPAENCIKGCHEEAGVDWKFEAPMPKGQGYNEIDGVIEWDRREIYHPMTQNGTSVEALKKLETCLDCHDARDNSFGFAAEACHICHDIEDEEMEAHGESTCSMATCHRDKDGNPVQPKLTGHNTVTDHCMECHSRDHPEDAFVPYTITNSKGTTFVVNSTFCSDCHKETYEELSVTNPKHFQENDCTECHLEHKTRPDCLTCHDEESVYKPDHIITEPFNNCTNCHERGGHDPKKITFSAYIDDNVLVSRDFCNNTACHKTDVYDEFEDSKLHTQEDFTKECLTCHDVHEADVDCSECHVAGGIGGVPEHSQSQPFDDCTSCHTDGHIPSQLNFTTFQETFQISIADDFCVECHADEKNELTDLGLGHSNQDCSSCHDTHNKEDVNCTSCHSAAGIAPEPPHLAQTPYDDCTSCHESGHAPKEITFGISIQTDFCAEVSCHGGPGGTATIFESYGGRHNNPQDCKNCHSSHEVGLKCSEVPGCHSGAPTDHDPSYKFEQCLNCHESTHDPLKKAPSLGSALSQRDYMSSYFVLNTTDMTESFRWIERGNHDLAFDPRNGDCAQCHPDSETTIYPISAQPLMNVSGLDCAGSCHEWIDPITTGTPISLINDSSNPFFRHFDIFNSTTSGGCVGTCHQSDPSAPVFDGSGHGEITDCLNSDCHGGGFTLSGSTHTDHQDMLTWTNPNLECYTVCHKGGIDYGEPIDGGCYDCHKSGHDPRILTTSPCYTATCHAQNWDP